MTVIATAEGDQVLAARDLRGLFSGRSSGHPAGSQQKDCRGRKARYQDQCSCLFHVGCRFVCCLFID
jgi:hypothetical protein